MNEEPDLLGWREGAPELHCDMRMGLDLGLGLTDNSDSDSDSPAPPPPPPPLQTFPFCGVLGVGGFGFFVFGAPEGF